MTKGIFVGIREVHWHCKNSIVNDYHERQLVCYLFVTQLYV